MANATDIITYIGVPLTVLGVVPILYNAVQCVLIRYRLLRSLPAAARTFFNLHPDPVGGTVLCSFRKPEFEFQDVLVNLRRGRAQIDIQYLPHVEHQGLGASWMRLIQAVGLELQRKKQVQRIIVDSGLDLDSVAMICSWMSFVYLALGLGVSPIDPTFHDLGQGKEAVSEHNRHSAALHSETGQRLIEVRWHEGLPCLELTDQCSSWSLRRSLAQFLHMISTRDGRQEVLHFVFVSNESRQTPTVHICDCKGIFLDPVKFSTLRKIHYTITWTLYFEDILHQNPYETILIPQSLLLLQFEITKELNQMPAEALQSRISSIFPSDTTLVANIISALTSIWSSSDYQELLDGLSGGAHKSAFEKSQRPEPNTIVPSTQIPRNNHSLDLEKAIGTNRHTVFPSLSDDLRPRDSNETEFDLYPALHSSAIFQSLSKAYSLSAIIALKSNHPASSAPITATIDIDDENQPEALLARLVIALSAMRRSTKPKGWVTSIASGVLRYKIGPEAEEDMEKRLLEYEGRTMRIE